eukprot:802692-Pyramimonas_sp.AAC.1
MGSRPKGRVREAVDMDTVLAHGDQEEEEKHTEVDENRRKDQETEVDENGRWGQGERGEEGGQGGRRWRRERGRERQGGK